MSDTLLKRLVDSGQLTGVPLVVASKVLAGKLLPLAEDIVYQAISEQYLAPRCRKCGEAIVGDDAIVASWESRSCELCRASRQPRRHMPESRMRE